jgi:hypothetical protein
MAVTSPGQCTQWSPLQAKSFESCSGRAGASFGAPWMTDHPGTATREAKVCPFVLKFRPFLPIPRGTDSFV